MTTHSIGKIAFAVALGAALACGNNTKSTIGSTSTALEFCNTVADITKAKFAECQHATEDYLAVQKKLATTTCQATAGEVAKGRIGYDAAKGHDCAMELHDIDCGEFFARFNCGHGLYSESDSCKLAMPGKVANGGQCYDNSDCASGYCNAGYGTNSCANGTCLAWATAGQDCSNAICDPSLRCDLTDASGPKCKAMGLENAPCPCEDGLYCDSSGPGGPTCKALKTSGSCNSPGSVAWDCAVGYACASAGNNTYTCQPIGKAGESCTPHLFGSDRCAPGLDCDPRTSTCVTKPKAGETCAFARGSMGCMDGWCDEAGTKLCVGYKEDGEGCSDASECRGLCDSSSSKCSGGAGLTCPAP